ncbi:hypothetical protein VTL71DRAFT_7745 [Oculimacula yallundae]|uniref:Uncharacterized protein n=1 Tax=Oculimacula yallundae TaxID=86028 RepID=A0ABR4CWK4_9HELO
MVDPSHIKVVTPYLKQVSMWEQAIRFHPELKGVVAITPESFQGEEDLIVLWNTVLGASVKGGYSWLPEKTPHVYTTLTHYNPQKSGDEETYEADKKCMTRPFDWFTSRHRVVTVNAQSIRVLLCQQKTTDTVCFEKLWFKPKQASFSYTAYIVGS